LIHDLFIEWAQYDTKTAFENLGVDPELAIIYSFLIYTPIIILFSWLLEWAVDTPSKKWASSTDITARDDGKDKDGFWGFLCSSWQFWCLIGWFSFILVTTEVYQAVRTPRDNEDSGEFSRVYYMDDG